MFALALNFSPVTANAQGIPPAGDRELDLGQIIRQAGYDCSLVASIEVVPDSPPGWESLRPEIALCINGNRYLVAKSGRSGGNIRPVVRPIQ
jgi:hypothetical protein